MIGQYTPGIRNKPIRTWLFSGHRDWFRKEYIIDLGLGRGSSLGTFVKDGSVFFGDACEEYFGQYIEWIQSLDLLHPFIYLEGSHFRIMLTHGKCKGNDIM